MSKVSPAGSGSELAGEDLIVHAVHGTWPYGPPKTFSRRRRTRNDWSGPEPPWFQPGSSFVTEVTQGRAVTWLPFEWSGDNTFGAREEAIKSFRDTLRSSLAGSAVPHAIVAHSHGGTVAVAAVAGLTYREKARIEGIVTMGTPFATLKYGHISMRSVVEIHLRYVALLPPLLVALSVWGLTRLQASQPFASGLGLAAVLWLAVLALVFWAGPGLIEWRRRRTASRRPSVDIFEGAADLKTSLVALRASGDEATLAIGSAQALRFASEAAFRGCSVFFADSDQRRDGPFARSFWPVSAALFAVALSTIAVRYWNPFLDLARSSPVPAALAVLLATGIACVVAILGLLVAFVLGVSLVTAALATVAGASGLALAHAIGSECLDFVAEVECEPVPAGVRAMVETLTLKDRDHKFLDQRGLLRHSFHELPLARSRVADAISDWLAPGPDMTRALREGGQARELVFHLWIEEHRAAISAGRVAARQLVGRLVEQTRAAAGELPAFQLLQRLRTLLPEADQSVVGNLVTGLDFSSIQAVSEDIRRKLDEL